MQVGVTALPHDNVTKTSSEQCAMLIFVFELCIFALHMAEVAELYHASVYTYAKKYGIGLKSASKFSCLVVLAYRTPEGRTIKSASAILLALFFNIILSLLFGVLYEAAMKGFFSSNTAVFRRLCEKHQFLLFYGIHCINN